MIEESFSSSTGPYGLKLPRKDKGLTWRGWEDVFLAL